jgi:hypothetical protein
MSEASVKVEREQWKILDLSNTEKMDWKQQKLSFGDLWPSTRDLTVVPSVSRSPRGEEKESEFEKLLDKRIAETLQ